MELKNNRKEVILGRLKKTAAKLWDYQESDTEGFDPVVDLLFGACASEFEKLSDRLNISQTRILEKVSQILLPEVYLHPCPSYAVIHAKPVVPERFTDQIDQLVFEKDMVGISNRIVQKQVTFSPTSRFRLIDAKIAILATTNEIIQIKDLFQRETIFKSATHKTPQKNNIWIGLKTNPSLNNLRDISFYFDWINNPDKEDLLKLLRLTRLYVDGENIPAKSGFSIEVDNKYKIETGDILSFLDISLKTEKKINSLFEPNFITITGDIIPAKKKFPPEFKDYYRGEDLDKMKEDLCWIQIELPEVFPVEFLTSTFCTLNAFPVLNRKLHSSNRPYTLNEDLNILPIIADDHFFSIRNIISNNHINYQEVPFKRLSDFAPGTFTIRSAGVTRFDERNASDYVQYLLELLREEYIAFKSLGSSMIEKELNDLQIIINRLNLSISKSKEQKTNTHFVLIKSEIVEDVWIEFWSTTGIFGNNVQTGSNILNNDFEKKSLKLLVTSAGGKNPPDQIERIFLFKNELLTRDRVVTNEDIRVICFAELGNDLKEVSIAPGTMISRDSKSGFQDCIHVKLRFNSKKSIAEKNSFVKLVGNSLKQKSSCLYRYNIEYLD